MLYGCTNLIRQKKDPITEPSVLQSQKVNTVDTPLYKRLPTSEQGLHTREMHNLTRFTSLGFHSLQCLRVVAVIVAVNMGSGTSLYVVHAFPFCTIEAPGKGR